MVISKSDPTNGPENVVLYFDSLIISYCDFCVILWIVESWSVSVFIFPKYVHILANVKFSMRWFQYHRHTFVLCSMLYQAIVSYPSHLICNLLNLYKDKVGAREFFFSKVSFDWHFTIRGHLWEEKFFYSNFIFAKI